MGCKYDIEDPIELPLVIFFFFFIVFRIMGSRYAIEDPIELAHDLGSVIFSPEANTAIVRDISSFLTTFPFI